MSRFQPENFSHEPEKDPYENLGLWDRIVTWYYEDFRYFIRKLLGNDDDPRGGIAR